MERVTMPGGVVSMSAENCDKLLSLGQGDAALLYVALLRWGGDLPQTRRALRWTEGRVDAAYGALMGLGMVGPAPAPAPSKVPAEEAPEYLTRDINAALEGDPAFAALQAQVERLLGSILSTADLKTLYYVYDYLAMPPEVTLMITTWCIEEMERKYGPGRRPRVSQIKKAAQRWRDGGIDTLEAAEEHLRRQGALREKEAELLPLVGIRDRAPLEKERSYLSTWIDWGFAPDAIALAYQKTIMKKQSMSWPYMNSILKSWHGKGLHNAKAVEAGDHGGSSPRTASPAEKAREGEKSRRVAADLADLRRMKGKEG